MHNDLIAGPSVAAVSLDGVDVLVINLRGVRRRLIFIQASWAQLNFIAIHYRHRHNFLIAALPFHLAHIQLRQLQLWFAHISVQGLHGRQSLPTDLSTVAARGLAHLAGIFSDFIDRLLSFRTHILAWHSSLNLTSIYLNKLWISSCWRLTM